VSEEMCYKCRQIIYVPCSIVGPDIVSCVRACVRACLCVDDEQQACRGTVLTESDSDSDSDDDDKDDDGDGDGGGDGGGGGGDDGKAGKVLMDRAVRRCHEPKSHGTVRVLFDGCHGISRHRVGREGHVDVWCIDTAPGGQYYRDHLAVLDPTLMSTSRCRSADDDDDDDETAADGGVCSIRPPLGNSAVCLSLITCYSCH